MAGLVGPPILFILSSIAWDGFVKDIVYNIPFLREANQEEAIQEHKEAAENAVEMMRDSVNQIIEKERRSGGIIIIEAWYGNFGSRYPQIADVTIPVQNLVSNNRLLFQSKVSKSGLEGFYDPCPNKRKELWIHYQFQGKSNHTVLVGDRQPFSLPKKSKFAFSFQ